VEEGQAISFFRDVGTSMNFKEYTSISLHKFSHKRSNKHASRISKVNEKGRESTLRLHKAVNKYERCLII
jgi:hypothetical protein